MGQYLPILVMLVLTVLFAALSFVASYLFAPRRPTVAKRAPYECGIVPQRDIPSRFPVRFFLVAMIFIVFDIEIIFFLPWAVIYRQLGGYGLVAIVLFAVMVFESFVYLISKGALEWGPAKREMPVSEMVGPERTMTSTVKRVGLDGRDPFAADDTAPDPEREEAA
jgi:NADH-quinone oxidoreductase subunit A